MKEKDLLGDKPEVVGTLMTNLGLENYLKEKNIQFYRTNVGDRYIIERMRESGAKLGGENSGHLIFGDFSTTGDAIIAALKVIECAYHFKGRLKDLMKEIELYPQRLINVPVAKKIPFEEVKDIVSAVGSIESELGQQGRVLLRYSGTENLARVMIEGKNKALVDKLCEQLADVVKGAIG
jgi:phosphoglucosamine mutase